MKDTAPGMLLRYMAGGTRAGETEARTEGLIDRYPNLLAEMLMILNASDIEFTADAPMVFVMAALGALETANEPLGMPIGDTTFPAKSG